MFSWKYAENIVITNKNIVSIFKIEPVDVLLMSDSEQAMFSNKIFRLINNIGREGIQIVMRTRNITKEYLQDHVRDLYSQNNAYDTKEVELKARELMDDYISSLTNLAETTIIPVREYLLVFSTPLTKPTRSEIKKSIEKMNREVEIITGLLLSAGIGVTQVVNTDSFKEKGVIYDTKTSDLSELLTSFTRL